MADNDTLLFQSEVKLSQEANYEVTDLAPNNYLTIIWRDKDGNQVNTLDINDKQAMQFTNDLNNAIEQGINNNNVSYVGSNKYINVESIAKYLAQNAIPNSPKRTVVNALIGLASGNNNTLTSTTTNLIVNMFGQIADQTASAFGFSDPHEVFASLANENVIPFLDVLSEKTSDFIQNSISKFSKKGDTSTSSKTSEESKKYVGLLLGLTTSDTESYEIIIPRKKVEDGSDYTTHILPQAYKKDFTVILTNKVLSSDYNKTIEIENIEKVKDKLIEIANSRILFDIYIRLSKDKCYKRSKVYFSSISFTKDETSGNGYICTFTIEPITSFKTKTFISNRKYFPTASKPNNGNITGSGSGGTGSTSSSQRNSKPTSSKGNKLQIEHLTNPNATKIEAKSVKDAIYRCRQQGKMLLIISNGDKQAIRYVNKNEVTTIGNRLVLKSDTWGRNYDGTPLFKKGFLPDKQTGGVKNSKGYTYKIYK